MFLVVVVLISDHDLSQLRTVAPIPQNAFSFREKHTERDKELHLRRLLKRSFRSCVLIRKCLCGIEPFPLWICCIVLNLLLLIFREKFPDVVIPCCFHLGGYSRWPTCLIIALSPIPFGATAAIILNMHATSAEESAWECCALLSRPHCGIASGGEFSTDRRTQSGSVKNTLRGSPPAGRIARPYNIMAPISTWTGNPAQIPSRYWTAYFFRLMADLGRGEEYGKDAAYVCCIGVFRNCSLCQNLISLCLYYVQWKKKD